MNFEEVKSMREKIEALEKVDIVVSAINVNRKTSFAVDSQKQIQDLLTSEDLQAIQAILNNAADAIEQVIKLRKEYLQFRFEKAEAALAALSDNLTPTPNHE